MEKERRNKALLLSTLVVVVATLSIAFAAMSRTLSINGIAKMDTASWSVYFDNLSNATTVRGAKEVGKPNISDDKGTVENIKVKLSNPKDEISYTVDIVNDGTIDAEITMIKDIELTEAQKKIFEFKVTYTDTGELLQNGDLLTKGTTKNITINIRFKDDIEISDLPTESQTINLSYQVTYTQADGEIEDSGSSGETEDDGYVEEENYEYVQNDSVMMFMARPMFLAKVRKTSSIISAGPEGNVFANKNTKLPIVTNDNVEQIKVSNLTDGTEIIWTKDNSNVTDNGDGTLSWTYTYKLLEEKEYEFTADAMVDGAYEELPANFKVTTTSISITLKFIVQGTGKLKFQYSGTSSSNISTMSQKTVPKGSVVTITALEPYEDSKFYYWLDATSNHVFSNSKTLKFIANKTLQLDAQYTTNEEAASGKKFIAYLDNDNIYIDGFEVAEGETYTVPSAPKKDGYTFTGWSMTQQEALAATKRPVIVKAQYTKNSNDSISVNGGSYNASSAGGNFVDVVAPEKKDGKNFSYWMDSSTNTILAYSNEATILVKGQMSLTPVYGVDVYETPLINIIQKEYNSTNKILKLWTNYWLPDGYQEVERGFIVNDSDTYWFYNDGYGSIYGLETGKTNNIKAYVLYADKNGELHYAYSEEIAYTTP